MIVCPHGQPATKLLTPRTGCTRPTAGKVVLSLPRANMRAGGMVLWGTSIGEVTVATNDISVSLSAAWLRASWKHKRISFLGSLGPQNKGRLSHCRRGSGTFGTFEMYITPPLVPARKCWWNPHRPVQLWTRLQRPLFRLP